MKITAIKESAKQFKAVKTLMMRGEGEKKMFVCVCGHREKLSDFEKRKSTSGASKRDVQNYLINQKEEPSNSAMAQQLAKWLDADK